MFIAAILSSFINNIGAMALLLPITLATCQRMGWHAEISDAFGIASILEA